MKRILLAILLCIPNLVRAEYFDEYAVISPEEYAEYQAQGMIERHIDPNQAFVKDPRQSNHYGRYQGTTCTDPVYRDNCEPDGDGASANFAMAVVAVPVVAKVVVVVAAVVIGTLVAVSASEDQRRLERAVGRMPGAGIPDHWTDQDVVSHFNGIEMGAYAIDDGYGPLIVFNENKKRNLSNDEWESREYARVKNECRHGKGTDEDPDPTGFPKLYDPISQDGKYGKINKVTHEIYVKDPSNHGGAHWEVYRNRIEWKNGNRSHKVYSNGQLFRYGNRKTLNNKPIVR